MKNAGEFVMALLNARTLVHIHHLKPGPYQQHIALGELYAGLGDLIDEFAEVYQGCCGPIEFTSSSFSLRQAAIPCVEALLATLQKARAECEMSHLQNIIDEMLALTGRTLYKLKYLS